MERAASLGRRALCAVLCLGWLAAAPPAAASYLDRAGFLIAEATRANEFLGKRLADRELARLVAESAEGRLEAAKQTRVPAELALAHPHLLLVLEHYERAAAAAARGEQRRFGQHTSAARDEEQLLRSVLRQLGTSLPEPGP